MIRRSLPWAHSVMLMKTETSADFNPNDSPRMFTVYQCTAPESASLVTNVKLHTNVAIQESRESELIEIQNLPSLPGRTIWGNPVNDFSPRRPLLNERHPAHMRGGHPVPGQPRPFRVARRH